MPRKRKEQLNRTAAGRGPSTGLNAETVARDECVAKLHCITEDAENFLFQLTHAPKGDAVMSLWSAYPKLKTHWLRAICDAVKDYVASLYSHRANLVWVRGEVEKNWGQFKAERERWTGIISEILLHAGALGGVRAQEQQHAVQAAKAEHEAAFASAKQTALNSADVAIANPVERAKLPAKKVHLEMYQRGCMDAAKLTASQHEVFLLRMERGMSFAKIGERMGIDKSTAHEHFVAAKTKIEAQRTRTPQK